MASWNATGLVANAARSALVDAAGVAVPPRSLVIRLLAVYLALLVPVNWLLFRMVRRVEWAWIAAPLIAAACGGCVVHLAQLDMGFARSQNEVGVLEVHGGYPRGHLTRYVGVYCSLATSYNVSIGNSTAVVLPCRVIVPASGSAVGPPRGTVTYGRFRDVRLTGLLVGSNTTGVFHSEEMLELGGSLSLEAGPGGPLRLVNSTPLALGHVTVVRRRIAETTSERFEGCRVGTLPPGATADLVFHNLDGNRAVRRRRDDVDASPGEIDIGRLVLLGVDAKHVGPGETRLVGRIDGALPGLAVEPPASDVRAATLLVAHLSLGIRPPVPDTNTRADVVPPSSSGRATKR